MHFDFNEVTKKRVSAGLEKKGTTYMKQKKKKITNGK